MVSSRSRAQFELTSIRQLRHNVKSVLFLGSHTLRSLARLTNVTLDVRPPLDLSRFPEELREKIMDSCDVKTMTALANTSKYWDRKRSECIYFRVLSLLRHFQLEPRPFLDLLARSSSIISGSAALLIFLPGLFTPGDLDIYVPENSLDEVLDYLNTFTEYRSPEETPSKEEIVSADYDAWEFSEKYVAQVLKVYCPMPKNSGIADSTIVNIIAIRAIDPIQAISHFHSTPVMNIVTSKGAICMYPQLTLRMRGIINTKRQFRSPAPTPQFMECLEKYRGRGFDMAMALGKWPELRRNFATNAIIRDIRACVVAFPELSKGAESVKRLPKEVVLEKTKWGLRWELSGWSYLRLH